MDYILVQPGRPRPRFSLYLSSQLQYGIIIVYHRQCAFFLGETHAKGICSQCLILFGCSRIHMACKRIIVPPGISEEVHQALERLLRCERHARIDMVEPDRFAELHPGRGCIFLPDPVATCLAVTALTLPFCSTSLLHLAHPQVRPDVPRPPDTAGGG